MILVMILVASVLINIGLLIRNAWLSREIQRNDDRIAILEKRVERSPSMIPVHDR